MYIYRIEHRDTKEGPYAAEIEYSDLRQYDMGHAHTNDDHPSMWIDCKRLNNYDHGSYYCGFTSIEQLLTWFDGWLDTLHNNGFQCVVYDVELNHIAAGQKQIAFVKKFSDIVETKELTCLI